MSSKPAFITVFCLVLLGCGQKSGGLNTYNLTIIVKDYLTPYESAAVIKHKDTIMAVDNKSAYKIAVLKVTARRNADKITHNSVSTYRSFTLTDSLDHDVISRLPQSYKDSINIYFSSFLKK